MMTLPKWLHSADSHGTRRAPNAGAAFAIEISRWHLMGILAAVVFFCAVAFVAGFLVGKRAHPAASPAALVTPAPPNPAAPTPSAARERHLALAEVTPGTEFVNNGLAQPIADPIPNDATDAARMETHRQLQDFRAARRRAETPPLIGSGGSPAVPVIVMDPPATDGAPAAGVRYTLQVSVFESIEPARAIGSELEAAGYPVVVRELVAQGRPVFRVEVGDFASAPVATTFQRRFERESGYSGVLVPKL